MRFTRRYRSFISDVATLASGRAVSMVVKLALTPVVARLFDPSDFGVMALFVSIMSLASAVVTLRYERAIVLPDDEAEAARLAQLTLVLLSGACALALLASVLAVATGWDSGPLRALGPWILVVPLALALVGARQALEGLLVRQANYAPMARADVGQTLLTNLSRVGFGWVGGSSVWGLMASYLLGIVTRVVMVYRAARGTLREMAFADRASLVATAREYRDFPLHNAPTGFLRDFSNNMPVFALAMLFSPAVAGFYAMANRLVWMPVNTASVALRRVITQRLARYRNDGRRLLRPSLLASAAMAALAAVPVALLWLYAERLVPWLLGENWREAGEFVKVLSPLILIGWATRPSGALLVVLRRQALGLRIQVFGTLSRLAVFVYALSTGAEPLATLKIYVVVSILGTLATFFVGFWLAREHDRSPQRLEAAARARTARQS